jgi:4-hydroxymandelate oxidase
LQLTPHVLSDFTGGSSTRRTLFGQTLDYPILLAPEGARQAGRTLDTASASLEALPRIVAAVEGRLPILFDGGIRRGADGLKALALGAPASLIGRPYVYGLAAAGAVGVAHVLNILRTELEVAMALTGCPVLKKIDRSVLWLA